jgi:intracellular sulfur oxidation DsrE/DsrF family protein
MTTRRTFIAATAALAAIDTSANATRAASGSPYDLAALDARLGRPSRHRQVFAAARTAEGIALGYMRHALDAYESGAGEGPGTLHVAAVFYGRAVVLGLNDRAWRTYRLCEALRKRGDPLSLDTEGHPFADEMKALTTRGATFLVCDNALADWATYLTAALGTSPLTPDEVRADLRASLFPGALLIPAGMLGLNAAQEAHFTYVQASL